MFCVDGLVLQAKKRGEHDLFLQVLTADRGRILICAKGGRSVRSGQMPVSQPFTYSNMEVYEKNGFLWLKGGSVIHSFYSVSEDLESFAVASYMVESVQDFTDEGVTDESVLRLLLNLLYALSEKKAPPDLVKALWEFTLLSLSGYAPDLQDCAVCHKGTPAFFDIQNGRLLCPECKAREEVRVPSEDEREESRMIAPVLDETLAAMRYLEQTDSKKIMGFPPLGPAGRINLEQLAESFFLYHVGHSYKSLSFYKGMKGEVENR